MDNREAVEDLKYLISGDCTDNQMDFVEEITMAINALEKQIPKKPLKIDEKYNAERGEWVADYECPNCGNPYADDSFCSCCGQALDWRDEDG